jgi:hypothetical protein
VTLITSKTPAAQEIEISPSVHATNDKSVPVLVDSPPFDTAFDVETVPIDEHSAKAAAGAEPTPLVVAAELPAVLNDPPTDPIDSEVVCTEPIVVADVVTDSIDACVSSSVIEHPVVARVMYA